MLGNKGMMLEELINRTNQHYINKGIGLFYKRHLPVKVSKIDGAKISGYLLGKSQVDYYGIYKGKHIEFEAKSTNGDKWCKSQLKQHQKEYLISARNHGAICFIILYFSKYKHAFIVTDFDKSLSYSNCLEMYEKIEISFPGILDYIKKIRY